MRRTPARRANLRIDGFVMPLIESFNHRFDNLCVAGFLGSTLYKGIVGSSLKMQPLYSKANLEEKLAVSKAY